MGQKIDNLKYSGEVAKHFTGKAACAANDFAGGWPLYLALGSMIFSSSYMNMEDMDTTGTDQQEAVYQQVSDGINNLKMTLEESENLTEMRNGLESLRDSGLAEGIVSSDISIDSKIRDADGEVYHINRDVERQLKDVLSNIYLSGDETGLALSETTAHDFFTKIANLDIPAEVTSKDMKLRRMLLNEAKSEHLDEGFKNIDGLSKDIDDISISDVRGISDRYELAQTVAKNASRANEAGEFGLFGAAILSMVVPLLVSFNTGRGSTFRQWSYNKPQRPKVKKY